MEKFNRLFDYKQGLRFYVSYRKAFITLLFNLYPAGHLGLIPVTFFMVLPFIQLIVFLSATMVPVSKIFTVADTGVKIVVPAAFAVTEQFPALIKLRVEPDIEQIPVEEVEYNMDPLLDEVAIKSKVLLFTSTL